MRPFRRYAHVPLGGVILLLIVAVIAWLLERRVDGVWDPALRIATPAPAVVTIPPAPAEPALGSSATRTPSAPLDGERLGTAKVAPEPPEQFVLESGPFSSAAAADRVEDQLNRLGYPTVRIRRQTEMRLYVVVATGFASVQEARRTASDLGRGTVVEAAEGAEVVVDRVPGLGEAIAATRPVRARGLEVRVDEEVGPAAIYHIRYAQFGTRAEAEARMEALALLGVQGRVVQTK